MNELTKEEKELDADIQAITNVLKDWFPPKLALRDSDDYEDCAAEVIDVLRDRASTRT